MKEHGLEWVDEAATQAIPRRISRMSHDYMLVPRMRYGIECLLATPSELSSEMRKVMFRALPHLGVNRNFKKEFCTLSRQYHGLELVDWTVEKLSADVFVMLQHHWDKDTILGHCLRDAYELLQMETGLEGNIFSYNFEHLGHLATHSWMKILWHYLHHLNINLDLSSVTNIPPSARTIVPSLTCSTKGAGEAFGSSRPTASASSNASTGYPVLLRWTA
jgi:hypothetical protein